MVVIAAGTEPMSIGGALCLIAGGVAMAAVGLANYRGRARWMLDALAGPLQTGYFGIAWLGSGAAIIGLGGLLAHLVLVIGIVVMIPGFGLFALGVLGLVWLPPRLLPAWYLTGRDARRHKWGTVLHRLIRRGER